MQKSNSSLPWSHFPLLHYLSIKHRFAGMNRGWTKMKTFQTVLGIFVGKFLPMFASIHNHILLYSASHLIIPFTQQLMQWGEWWLSLTTVLERSEIQEKILMWIGLYDPSYGKTGQIKGPKPHNGWYVACKEWVTNILFIYLLLIRTLYCHCSLCIWALNGVIKVAFV